MTTQSRYRYIKYIVSARLGSFRLRLKVALMSATAIFSRELCERALRESTLIDLCGILHTGNYAFEEKCSVEAFTGEMFSVSIARTDCEHLNVLAVEMAQTRYTF